MQGKWLVFTDDDCLPSVDLLSKYFETIAANHSGLALEGAIHPLGDSEKVCLNVLFIMTEMIFGLLILL